MVGRPVFLSAAVPEVEAPARVLAAVVLVPFCGRAVGGKKYRFFCFGVAHVAAVFGWLGRVVVVVEVVELAC